MQEEIFFQGENTKTIVKYFTNFSGQTSSDDTKYFVIADVNNKPIKLVQSSFDTEFGLSENNYNLPLSAISGGYTIYTGTVVQSEIFLIPSNEEKDYISDGYNQRILNESGIDNTSINPVTPFSCVFFEEMSYNDYFLNVKLNRSVDILNTLNIYNVPINDTVKFNSDTGVLYGKIEAIQVLLDEQGNKIKIPLRNAIVGIFNPSDEFQSVGSVDDDGNRIKMTLYENMPSNLKSYGSFQSYLTDVDYTTKDWQNDTIPPKYKYTTTTNENGEFILYNVPVGSQTLMLEVDLLKQGLEPEEVALNFFPYPLNDEPNISNIPHLYFNQFPVNIVPSWGEFQTGYTEINLTVQLDLRKWVTYFTFPISSAIGNQSSISNTPSTQNSIPRVLEQLFAEGINIPLEVQIRDMTKPFESLDRPKVELVKIIDIYDRNLDLKCAWTEEFKTKNNKVEFTTSNYNAFKLPSNLYDPNGLDTNGNRGVWLGAYQFKIRYPNDNLCFHATGHEEFSIPIPNTNDEYKLINANFFDLNRYANWNQNSVTPEPGFGIGIYPFEKPWSLTYPQPYKITKKPSKPNPFKSFDNNGNPILNKSITNENGQTNNFTLTKGQFFLEPRYLDGDLVGGQDAYNTNANGFGLQSYGQAWNGNNFSREVTKNEIWRYESVDAWSETWSNGFNSICTPSNPDKYPFIRYNKPAIDGEEYQRLEAGYAYWLKPRACPRIKIEPWGDHLLENDYVQDANHDYGSVYNDPYQYRSYFYNIYKYIDEVTLRVGTTADFLSKIGRINAYRIEKPYLLNPKKPPFTENFVKLHLGGAWGDGKNNGGDQDKRKGLVNFSVANQNPEQLFQIRWFGIILTNLGTTTVTLNFLGNSYELQPQTGAWIGNDETGGFEPYSTITLPANSSYDPVSNQYRRAKYGITFQNTCNFQDVQPNGPYGGTTGGIIYAYQRGCLRPTSWDAQRREFEFEVGPAESETNYYLVSSTAWPMDAYNGDHPSSEWWDAVINSSTGRQDIYNCGSYPGPNPLYSGVKQFFLPMFNGFIWEDNHDRGGPECRKIFSFRKTPLQGTYKTAFINIPHRIFALLGPNEQRLYNEALISQFSTNVEQ